MIFADSSFFIAILREKDKWHQDGLKIADKINDLLIISELIISESITMVGSYEGGKAGKVLYEYFQDNCKIEIISFDSDFDKVDEIGRIH